MAVSSPSARRRPARPGKPCASSTSEVLEARSDAAFTYAGMLGDRAFFRTDLDAPNGRVVSITLAGPERGTIREVVREQKAPISTWSSYGPAGAVLAGERLVVTRIEDGRHRVRIHALDGRLEHEA